MITNGHVNDNRPLYRYAMPSQALSRDRPDGRLVDVSSQAGPPWEVLRVGRGLAAGDLDNDGRCDAVIVAQNEPLAYFHNRTRHAGHFVTLALEGTTSNRDGSRGPRHRHGRRPAAGRPASSAAAATSPPTIPESLRARRVRPGRVDRGALAVGPGRPAGPTSPPTPATGSAKATRHRGRWRAGLAPGPWCDKNPLPP